MNKPKLIRGPWNLSDLKSVPKNGLNVFSCFACGGGSTMGYKLSGYNVLGCVEIDPKIIEVYRKNHHPKYSFLMGVQDFVNLPKDKIPEELFNLDILDGSPPCSSFSKAGARERLWGKEKKFKEGQAKQVLDDLFFHFISLAKRLQPKVVISENVKGLIMGNARGYVKQIFKEFDLAGYDTQLFLLNASRMGVPQARERFFFISTKKSLGMNKLELSFNEPLITVKEAWIGLQGQKGDKLWPCYEKIWDKVPPGEKGEHYGGTSQACHKINRYKVCRTLTSQNGHVLHDTEKRNLSILEYARIQSFPDDYNYVKEGNAHAGYICGMSVPPLMMQRVSYEVAKQLFKVY